MKNTENMTCKNLKYIISNMNMNNNKFILGKNPYSCKRTYVNQVVNMNTVIKDHKISSKKH